MDFRFIPSESCSVQGSKDKIFEKYGKEWNIREQGKGNGNWLLTKKSDALIDGKSFRDFILDYYKKSKLTEKLFYTFKQDVESEKIKIK